MPKESNICSFWPWITSKSRCVIKAMDYLDQKAIRWPVILRVVGKKSSGKRKGRRQGETTANRNQIDSRSADEINHLTK